MQVIENMPMKDLTNVSSAFLAEVLGMTRHGVSKLYALGVIKQNGRARGKYSLFDAVPAYLDYLRATKGGDSPDTRLKMEQARKLRLQIEKMEAELVDTGIAAQVFATFAATLRQLVNSRIDRLADRIAKCDDSGGVANMMQSELDDIAHTIVDETLEVIGNED